MMWNKNQLFFVRIEFTMIIILLKKEGLEKSLH